MTSLSEQQLNDVLEHLKEKLEVKVKTKRDEGYLAVRVELYLDGEVIAADEDSARVDY